MYHTLGHSAHGRRTPFARCARPLALLTAALLLPALGCKKDNTTTTGGGSTGGAPTTRPTGPTGGSTAMATAVANIAPAKGAATQPANKEVTGTVTFTQQANGVKVVTHLTGLSPGKHGIHIHEKADLSAPDLMSAGGHFNPEGHKHGAPDSEARHAGDLGNIEANADGKADLDETVTGLTIGDGGKDDIVGHSVIIHLKEDDLKTDPSGNSGGRIAGGVIEKK
jgi:Cu-Zn family superoxide dismutase